MSPWFTTPTPLIIGHRGASADAPENTLAAFALALEQGADGIEFDVQLAADGVPVIFHDADLARTTNGRGPLIAHTSVALRRLDAGQGQPIATLDELLATFGRRLLYNLEIKNFNWRDQGAEAAIAARIRAHGLDEHVLISSFNPLALRRVRRHLTANTPLALLRMSGRWRHTARLFQGQADHPHYPLIDEAYMAWANQRQMRVHAWTVDDPTVAQRLVALGVHGLITNKPAFLRQNLKS